jgi:hypothetical protein
MSDNMILMQFNILNYIECGKNDNKNIISMQWVKITHYIV